MRSTYIFDIETGPLPEEEILANVPFKPGKVKLGKRTGDAVDAYLEQKQAEHKSNLLKKAALSALTGKVVAIGVKLGPQDKDCVLIIDNEETRMVGMFFEMVRIGLKEETQWIGFNITNFDLPFLLRRAWALGIKPPSGLINRRYLTNGFLDLADVWKATSRDAEHISLDRLAQFLKLGAKNGHGEDFAKQLIENEQAAREYLTNDLAMTWRIAERLGVIEDREASD
jgi:predicted PolB exonuclease-like 3'-5' exonuclease